MRKQFRDRQEDREQWSERAEKVVRLQLKWCCNFTLNWKAKSFCDKMRPCRHWSGACVHAYGIYTRMWKAYLHNKHDRTPYLFAYINTMENRWEEIMLSAHSMHKSRQHLNYRFKIILKMLYCSNEMRCVPLQTFMSAVDFRFNRITVTEFSFIRCDAMLVPSVY